MPDLDPMTAERVDFAWRCHNAQESWTAKVDTKASILLTANLVGIAALIGALSNTGTALGTPGWHRSVATVATSLACVAVVGTTAVIFPLLGSQRAPDESNLVYFGNLRSRTPVDVAQQITKSTTEDHITQLARQLVVMARINWIKHRLLQASLMLSITAYLLATMSALS